MKKLQYTAVWLSLGQSDIFEEPINEEELKDFYQAVKEAYKMIHIEYDVAELDGLFRSITKSLLGGRLIEGYREIKKAYEKKHNKRSHSDGFSVAATSSLQNLVFCERYTAEVEPY